MLQSSPSFSSRNLLEAVSDLFKCKCLGLEELLYLSPNALALKNECLSFFNNQNRLPLKPLKPDPLRRCRKGFFLSPVVQGGTVFTEVATRAEASLKLTASAVGLSINQKPCPQVAHRSQSPTMESGRNSDCVRRMPRLRRGNQSPGASKLPVPPPLTASTAIYHLQHARYYQ